ncbi:FtsX-like permease family protein [Streptoalloteichus hindustanus]|uniref:ABC-type transport system, involved in lipoprotein release, permease component n=1 Tax=Streptoalloteichus hindustanus TaxID=2017 RepID=A0A1M5IYN4_STRHI|nr:FtsX-like permease family protein [Streptoalloteichus hindustanus]SHG33416.1 ABC-type transport system, involved in lipoprotein release, permease component [Streptoalloteichus hindustanus]
MSAGRVALRLASRSLTRNRRRALLMVAVLAVPLAVGFALSTLRSTSVFSQERLVSRLIGQSQTVLLNPELVSEQGVQQTLTIGPTRLAAVLGRSAAVFPEVTGPLAVSSQGRQALADGFGLDLGAPVHQGRFELHQGRAPRRDGEVAISRAVAERLGTGIGFEVGLGGGNSPAEVTGILVDVTDTTRQFAVTTPAEGARLMSERPADGGGGRRSGAAAGWDQRPAQINWHSPERVELPAGAKTDGWRLETRAEAFRLYRQQAEMGGEGSGPLILGVTVLVVVEIGLVLGAAYAIVVRSSRRELGLLAVAGAGPGLRRLVITCQGLFVGVVATFVAGVVGVLTAWPLVPVLAARSYQVWGPLRLDLLPLLALVGLGVMTPAVAAWVASRGVRGDLVAALRGVDQVEPQLRRRSVPAAVFAFLAGGTVSLLGGAALGALPMVLVGALALVVGVGMLLRVVLPVLARGGRRWRLLPRLGLRITGRSPGRAVALGMVVASLTLVGGLVLAAMGGLTEQAKNTHVPVSPPGSAFVFASRTPQPTTLRAMAEALGVDRVVRLGIASPPLPPRQQGMDRLSSWGHYQALGPVTECLAGRGPIPGSEPLDQERCRLATGFPTPNTPVAVIDGAQVDLVLGRAVSSEERQALAEGRALVLDDRLAPGGVLTVQAPDPASPTNGAPARTVSATLPAFVARSRSAYGHLPMVYVTQEGLDRLGAVVQPNDVFLFAPAPAREGGISPEQEDRARAVLSADIGAGFFRLDVERGPRAAEVYRASTVAIIALLTLVSATLAFVTVSLSTREIRPELSAMAAVGADRRFRSWLSGSHAGTVTALGVGVGVAVTVAATPAVLAALKVSWTPWPWVGLLVAAVVAVAAAVLAGNVAGARIGTVLRRAER